MNNDQNNFDGKEQNDEEYDENIHPEAYEENIEFCDEVPDNFFDLLNNQKDLSIHYKQMVKIIARTNIIKTQNDNLKKHNLKINNIISDCEKLIGEENKENFKIEINAKKNLTKDELEDTMKILNLISETQTTQNTDLEIVIALLKKLLNYFNVSLSNIENSEIETPIDIYKKLNNNKLILEDIISTLEVLDFS